MSKDFKPSKYQENIYDFITNQNGNAVVSAVAGSGKTTTLINAIDIIPSDKNILFLAFNKSIASELVKKIPSAPNVTIKTVHAFGMAMITSQLPFSQQSPSKYKTLLREIISNKNLSTYNLSQEQYELVNNIKIDEDKKIQIDNMIDYINTIATLTDLGRMNLINIQDNIMGVEQLCNIAKHHGILTCNQECTSAWYLIKLGSSITDIIDFTDMIYLPIIHNLKSPTFDFVFLDEAQDTNACQRELMLRTINEKTGRFIAVGDKYQCQPPETMVRLSNGNEVRIDQLKIGDNVISYNSKQGKGFVGYYNSESFVKRYADVSAKILDIAQNHFDGNLIKIKTDKDEFISKYTPNHRCLIKYKNVDSYVLYLMEKNDRFRIGIMPVQSKYGFGLSIRSRQEKVEKSWILKVFQTKEEAYNNEQFYSYEYGIPQLRFVDNFTGTMSQETMDSIWDRFDKDKMLNNAKSLLTNFDRLYEYPLWYKNSNIHNSRTGIAEIRACNIVSEIMLVPCFNKNNRGANGNIKADFQEFELSQEYYCGSVFSLKVSKEECYVADNILTHNSIYGFAGADTESFDKLCNLPNTTLLPLSVSYRCSTDIIDKVKAIVPNIEAKPQAIKGQVEYLRSYKQVKANDMVLCRQTFPLVSLCLLYLSNDIKAYVNGSDIGKALAKMVLDTKEDNGWTTQIMFSKLYAEREKLLQNIIAKENLTREEAFNSSTINNYTEKIQVIELLANNKVNGILNDPQTIVDKINKIFSDEDNNGIMLSTIHKAKGLEADRVFIIHEDLMPSKHATKQWELQQERNLMYVAFTRAKSYLGFISDFDAFKSHKSEEHNVTPIVQSKHVGRIGERIHVKAEVYSVKDITTKYGESIVIEMKDDNGNVFTKFGDINSKYITSNHRTITNGAKVNLMGVVKTHNEFRGVKSTLIGLK